jgi:phosphoribosylformylglycinamidine synthase
LGVKSSEADAIMARLLEAGIPARLIGHTGGGRIVLPGEGEMELQTLREVHESWFPGLFRGESEIR